MELLIFSDSHGRADGIRMALDRQVTRPHAVLFLGDGLRDAELLETGGIPLYAVRGNCDTFLAGVSLFAPEEYLSSFEGHLILMTHGARYGVKLGLESLIASAAQKGADIVLYGHTHVPSLKILEEGTVIGDKPLSRPMYLFNPGSIGGREQSFGVLTLRDGNVLFSHGSLN